MGDNFFFQTQQVLLHLYLLVPSQTMSFPGGSDGKASAYNAGDLGSIPGSGRSPGEGHGNPLQYSCLENPIDRGTWWTTVCGVAKSQTQLSDFTFFLSQSMGFSDISVGKESTSNAGDPGSIAGLGRSAEEEIGCPLQYSWASLVAELVNKPPAMQET